jgi:hypothetical protein
MTTHVCGDFMMGKQHKAKNSKGKFNQVNKEE